MRSAPLGQDVLYDELHVELGRNFCNKLWNACRFRQLQGGSPEAEVDPALLTVDDKWLLLKLDRAIREISNAFAEYRFTEVTQTLHRFFWNEYCDWYIEASKAVFQGDDPARKANTLAVIDFVLSHTLRLFHPFLPFVTEELWHGLGFHLDLPDAQGGQTIMFAPWPKPLDDEFKAYYGLDESDERVVDARCELIGRGRNLRREFNIPGNRKVAFTLRPAGTVDLHHAEVLRLLLNAETVDIDPQYAPPKGTPSALTEMGELFMPLAGLLDVEAERARLSKELAKNQIEIDRVQAKLDNPAFVQKVPPAVLEDHQKRLADAQAKYLQLKTSLDALGSV
jgi:valyl-tRNA synthetase